MYSWPFNLCDNYEECGVNGNCRISKTPICGCLKGYVPKSQDEWNTPQTTECIKKLPSDCPSGEGFLKLPRMKLPDIDWAYANSDLTGGGTGCLMCFKDLTDMGECSKQYTWGQDIFLRVPASELAKLPLEASSTSSPGFIHHREMFD
ncbi:hypothetical protein Pint_04379 [Pistacia integerrima]|uniref:Uncharacterized protein n=1 Tax=Pistacia integerrima TaxID=434235 RepID=A0ACC0Z4H5_9ROSI|nr:hypothetical protein Pint_04379 [Pistacia integerrima]